MLTVCGRIVYVFVQLCGCVYAGYAALHLATQFGHTSVVAYLLAKGQDPDLPDASGMTPLMWAATRIFGYLSCTHLHVYELSVERTYV